METTWTFASTGTRLERLGAGLWIVGTIQFYVMHVIVELAWNPPYSWAQNNISDLGNVTCGRWGNNARYVCSPLHTWMNTSIVLYGVLAIAGLALLAPLWTRKFLPLLALALLFLAGIGYILAGLVPADVDENLHVLAALLVFLWGNLGLVLMGNPNTGNRMQRVRGYSILLGAIGLIATALFVSGQYLGLGMGGMERLVVWPQQIWALVTGVYILRTIAAGDAQRELG